MDDWDARLDALEARLKEWNRRFDAGLREVLRERGYKGLRARLRAPREEELREAAALARRRAGSEVLAELERLLDAICDRYPTVLPQERARIRARVGMCEAAFDLFWAYAESMPERVRASRDPAMLARAFSAIAIDDMRAELHLIDDVLGRLILAAAAAGIDWKPILAASARAANKGAGGGGACMREHLEGFERSAPFRERVAPGLREAARAAPAR